MASHGFQQSFLLFQILFRFRFHYILCLAHADVQPSLAFLYLILQSYPEPYFTSIAYQPLKKYVFFLVAFPSILSTYSIFLDLYILLNFVISVFIEIDRAHYCDKRHFCVCFNNPLTLLSMSTCSRALLLLTSMFLSRTLILA